MKSALMQRADTARNNCLIGVPVYIAIINHTHYHYPLMSSSANVNTKLIIPGINLLAQFSVKTE